MLVPISPVIVKYLGISKKRTVNTFQSFEIINCKPKCDHNGKTDNNNSGKYGYCVYDIINDVEVIKELTKEEIMMELL